MTTDDKKRSHDVVEHYEPNPDDIQVQVQVIEAKNLYKTDLFGKTNPYMGIYVTNESFPRVKTKVQHKTLNPKYNGIVFIIIFELSQ
jgi:Ca2+-dependent lipid-binding protein